uniref:PEGA domain-containing protein n=1 Tax=Pseudothermotoga hypogea TaxID=57487 RepID=A0A832MMH2_9THEM
MKKIFYLLLLLSISLLITQCAAPVEQPRGSVRGTVKDSENQPVQRATVVVNTTNLRTETDPQGSYQISNVPAGEWTITASKNGYTPESKLVYVEAGQTVTVNFTLAPVTSTGTVRGTVRDNNAKPIQDATVAVQGTELQTTTNSDGQYEITNVPAGQRTIIASKSGYVSESKAVNVEAGQVVTVDFQLRLQEVQQVVWQKVFGGSNDDRAYSIQQTSDGGYIVAGYTWSSSNREEVYILKLDANGNKVWEKTFGGSYDDRAYCIQQTSDGGYIVAGYTKSFGAGGEDVYILKLGANGNKVWEKTFGGSSDDLAYFIQQTSDGGYVVAGYTWSSSKWEDVYILKLDANGNKVWEKTFGGSDNDGAYSVQQTNDGGYVAAGYTKSFGSGWYDAYVLKLDENGNNVWEKTFGGNSWDEACSIQQTSDGGYIVAGYTSSFGSGSYDVYILKLDTSGNEVWSKTFGESSDDLAWSIQQTSDGGYIVAGYTKSFGAGGEDVYILKLDAVGNKVWEKILGGSYDERAYCIQQTSDGGYIVAGYTSPFGAGNYDVYIIKMDANGNTGAYPMGEE